MKIRLLLLVFTIGLLAGCNTEKQMVQRQNFMMPEKSDLKRNEKYKGPAKKKTYTVNKKKKKTKKKY